MTYCDIMYKNAFLQQDTFSMHFKYIDNQNQDIGSYKYLICGIRNIDFLGRLSLECQINRSARNEGPPSGVLNSTFPSQNHSNILPVPAIEVRPRQPLQTLGMSARIVRQWFAWQIWVAWWFGEWSSIYVHNELSRLPINTISESTNFVSVTAEFIRNRAYHNPHFGTMARESQRNIGFKSWELPLRLLQFAIAASVMSLAAYTLSKYKNWAEVRFTVAAVC